MPRHVDDVVGARHDVHVAVFVDDAGVARLVVAGELAQVGVEVALLRVPQRGRAARRHRQLAAQGAEGSGRHYLPLGAQRWEERRVGKEGVGSERSRWWAYI